MFRIVLVDIFSNGHYGLRCVASALKNNGFDVKSIYGRNLIQDTHELPQQQLEALYELIKELKPDVLGLTAISTFSHYFLAEIAAKVKSFMDIPIILGGPYPSVSADFILKKTVVDYVCVGEGEATTVEFCQALSDGKDPEGIAGIMSKKTLEVVRRNPPSDLDSLDFQDLTNDDTYEIKQDGTVDKRDPLLRMTTYFTRASRGCPFHCTYCGNDALRSLYSKGTFCRKRSPRNVIDEIKTAMEKNPDFSHIWFMDDVFPAIRAWVDEFAKAYKEEIGLPFTIWQHPQMVKDQDMADLKQAGMIEVIIGIESASEKTRREVFLRKETNEHVIAADQVLSKHKLKKTYDFLFGHPWEDENELEETISLLSKLDRPYELNLHSCVILPGTEMAKRAEAEGLVTEEEIIDNMAKDPYSTSRVFQWIKGIPSSIDPTRQYYMILILMLKKKNTPMGMIKFLAKDSVAGNIIVVKLFLLLYKMYKAYGRAVRKIGRMFAGKK